MKKRFLCLMLAGTMVVSLAACGNKGDGDGDDKKPTPTTAASGDTKPTEGAKPTEGPAQVDFSVEEMITNILERVETPMMMSGSEQELSELYQIDPSRVEEYAIRVPMMNATATELAAFKAATEGDVQAVLDGIGKRLESLDATWSTYLPEQYELVKNHKLLTQGRYVLFVVGEAEVSGYAENVFMRKFDPSIKEIVIARKFRDLNRAVIKAISEDSVTLEYAEGDKTYTFECTFGEDFFADGGIESYAAGGEVYVVFAEPVSEQEGTMKGAVNWISEPLEELE